MNKKNLLVATGLVLLATACKEDYPVMPVRGETEVTNPKPVLVIPFDDLGTGNDGNGKPVQAKPEVPSSTYNKAVMPKTADEQ